MTREFRFLMRGSPTDLPRGDDWLKAEAELSVQLPADYKAFISQFGTGCLSKFIWIFNPAATKQNMELVFNIKQVREDRDALRIDYPDAADEEFPLFPEPGGILRWGLTFNGEAFNWLVTDTKRPDEWPVVITGGRMPGHEIFDMRATELLWALVTGEKKSTFFEDPAEEPLEPIFEPYSEGDR